MESEGVPYELFDRVAVEPTDKSWQEAIEWARKHDFSHFLAVGGGSVMDTAKAANLFTVYKDADLYDFINAPVGKGKVFTSHSFILLLIANRSSDYTDSSSTRRHSGMISIAGPEI
jgi:hydroxyacid-oxoacid transhydrogenase